MTDQPESFYKLEEETTYTYVSHQKKPVKSKKSGNSFFTVEIVCSDGISTLPRCINGKYIEEALATPDFIRKGEKFEVTRHYFTNSMGERTFYRRIINKTRGIKLNDPEN